MAELLSRQVIFSGRITDGITGAPPRTTPMVTATDETVPERRLGLLSKVTPDGLYALSGDPMHVLPPAATVVRITAEADGYTPQSVTVALSEAELTRTTETLDVGGEAIEVDLIPVAPVELDLALSPEPVIVAGRVVRAEEPETPIPGASVEITAPDSVGPVTTNEDGFFRLPPAPVAAEITLSVSAAGRESLAPVVPLDYRQTVNQVSFSLEPS